MPTSKEEIVDRLFNQMVALYRGALDPNADKNEATAKRRASEKISARLQSEFSMTAEDVQFELMRRVRMQGETEGPSVPPPQRPRSSPSSEDVFDEDFGEGVDDEENVHEIRVSTKTKNGKKFFTLRLHAKEYWERDLAAYCARQSGCIVDSSEGTYFLVGGAEEDVMVASAIFNAMGQEARKQFDEKFSSFFSKLTAGVMETSALGALGELFGQGKTMIRRIGSELFLFGLLEGQKMTRAKSKLDDDPDIKKAHSRAARVQNVWNRS